MQMSELATLCDRNADDPTLFDPEGVIGDQLLSIRDKALRQHELADRLAAGSKHRSLQEAAVEFSRVCCELASAASALYWDIGEHDASYAPRSEGFVASTLEEVDAMLDRILHPA